MPNRQRRVVVRFREEAGEKIAQKLMVFIPGHGDPANGERMSLPDTLVYHTANLPIRRFYHGGYRLT
jgi:hypothetical protein